MTWNPLSLSSSPPWEAEGISRRGSIARYAGAAAISAVVWLTVAEYQADAARWVLALDLALGAVAFVLVRLRRRHPFTIAVLLCLLSVFSATAAGPATLASVSLATRRHLPQVVAVGLVNVATAVSFGIYMELEPSDPLLDHGITVAFAAAMMGWGMYLGSRRELLYSLRERAQRAEAEQELRGDKARGDERARIAREMHDVLAHRISQVSMHAGALSYRTDLSADEMRESATVIQDQANRALEELRAVLGVLRDPGTGQLLDRPQPTWRDVAALIREARGSGLQVELTDAVQEPSTLPAAVGRTAYRMVQEGLTNARKHAPGATVFVQASGGPDHGLDIVIRNPIGFQVATAPSSGLGLVGLAERAELSGGTLRHGRDGSMFVLHGWLPWAA